MYTGRRLCGLRAEATGLRWLGEAGVALAPEVFFSSNEMLALPWLPQAGADREVRRNLYRELPAFASLVG